MFLVKVFENVGTLSKKIILSDICQIYYCFWNLIQPYFCCDFNISCKKDTIWDVNICINFEYKLESEIFYIFVLSAVKIESNGIYNSKIKICWNLWTNSLILFKWKIWLFLMIFQLLYLTLVSLGEKIKRRRSWYQ